MLKILTLLLLTNPTPLSLPKAIQGYDGDFIVIVAETPGTDVKWEVSSNKLKILNLADLLGTKSDPKRLVVQSKYPGKYKVRAITCKDNVLSDFATVEVTILPTDPVPVPDDDPLVTKLQGVYSYISEADKADSLKNLQALYKNSVPLPAGFANYGDIYTALSTTGAKLLGNKLMPLREAIAVELDSKLPRDRKLAPDVKLVELNLTRIGNALNNLK